MVSKLFFTKNYVFIQFVENFCSCLNESIHQDKSNYSVNVIQKYGKCNAGHFFKEIKTSVLNFFESKLHI